MYQALFFFPLEKKKQKKKKKTPDLGLRNVVKHVQHVCSASKFFFLLTAYRAFSHDVTAAILLLQNMFQNKETAAMFGHVGVPRKSSVS